MEQRHPEPPRPRTCVAIRARRSSSVEGAGFRFLTVESHVTILDGPDAPALNVRLFRVMQNRPTGPIQWYGADKSEPEFLAQMVAEERLIYQFDPVRAYGLA